MLRTDFGMRYKKVKRTPFHGNSERCLLLRQLFAKTPLAIMSSGKRVVNIDETWLPHTDFRRKKWRRKGDNNSASLKESSYRVNMIAALDSEG